MTLIELKRAAREDVREAQYLLGFLYENGLGCAADRAEAERWYRKAAERGLAAAQRWPNDSMSPMNSSTQL